MKICVTRRKFLSLGLMGLAAFGSAAIPARAQPVSLTISAAASMKDALTDIGRIYGKAHPNVHLSFNFGSSGTLQKQIEQGAPVDIFVSAADKQMDELQAQKLIDPQTRRNLAGNTLVLIVPRNSRLPIRYFKDVMATSVTHVAIGGPTVPAGMRAEEVFTRLGIWPQVQAKAVRGKDVREVLTQVELGNVEAGVVYGTDAAVSKQVRVVATAPAAMHKPIRYPLAVLTGSKNLQAARAFATYLAGDAAKAVLRKYKFIVR